MKRLLIALMLVGPALADDLTTNLVSYWKLDEESGTREDSHSTNDLTDNNTVLYAAGALNNAADFERDNNEYLSIADASQTGLDFTGDLSFSLWIKLESTPSWDGFNMIRKWEGSNRSYILKYLWDDAWKIGFWWDKYGDGGGGVLVTQEITTGSWKHLVIVFDASEHSAEFYLNGTSVGSSSTWTQTSIYNGTAPFVIGNGGGTAEAFDGLIDEVGVWSRVLTAAEVTSLYNSGTPKAYSTFASAAARRKVVIF